MLTVHVERVVPAEIPHVGRTRQGPGDAIGQANNEQTIERLTVVHAYRARRIATADLITPAIDVPWLRAQPPRRDEVILGFSQYTPAVISAAALKLRAALLGRI